MTCFLLALDLAAMWFGLWGMNLVIPSQWDQYEAYYVISFIIAFCLVIYLGL